MNKIKFGKYIKSLRLQKNWSQEGLSKEIKEQTGKSINRTYISRVENGKHDISIELASVFLSVFGEQITFLKL